VLFDGLDSLELDSSLLRLALVDSEEPLDLPDAFEELEASDGELAVLLFARCVGDALADADALAEGLALAEAAGLTLAVAAGVSAGVAELDAEVLFAFVVVAAFVFVELALLTPALKPTAAPPLTP